MSYRLALAMGRSVREISATIDADEWLGWLAFYSLEPWGTAVEDDRFEKVCRLLEGGLWGKARPEPFFDRDPKPVKPESLDDRIKGIFARVRAKQAAEEEADHLNN